MTSRTCCDRVLDDIYEAASQDGIAGLAHALPAALGARSSVIQLTDNLLRTKAIASNYFDPEMIRRYVADQIFNDDVWANLIRATGHLEHVHDCEDAVPLSTYMKSRFYKDFIHRWGDDTAHCLGFASRIDSGNLLTVGIHRPVDRQFDRRDSSLLQSLLPHARRAIGLHIRLGTAAGASAALEGAVRTMPTATVARRLRSPVGVNYDGR